MLSCVLICVSATENSVRREYFTNTKYMTVIQPFMRALCVSPLTEAHNVC